jgi:hypothetical protein
MSPEWIIAGVILLGAMTAGSISLYLKRRKSDLADDTVQQNFDDNA